MKYITKYLAVLILASTALVSGCSFEVVEPATKGKILGTAGYQKGVLAPGKYTLWGRDRLVKLHTNTATYKETVKVLMSDKLTLRVDVRFRGRINDEPTVIDAMFNDISAVNDSVTFAQVYNVYGQMAVRNVTREVISKYNTEDVNKNYARISQEIGKALTAELSNTPVMVSDVALGDIAYPKVITDAVEDAKGRDLAIKKEEANARIALVKKKNEQVLAEADYDIKTTRAKAERDANKIMGESITPQLIALRRIEAIEAMTANGSTVFMPFDAMGNVGASNRIFNK